MIDKKGIIERLKSIEEIIFLAKVLDKAIKAEKSRTITYTDFLDPYQQKLVTKVFNGSKKTDFLDDVESCFDGGFEDAERKIIIFDGSFNLDKRWENDNKLQSPIRFLNIKLKADAYLSHRNYLGSILGLGIKREKIGDIVVKENSAIVVVLKDVAEYILYNLVKIGSIGAQVEYCGSEDIICNGPTIKFKEIKCTVPSLRLDCIISQGFGISRSKVGELFTANRVFLNWEPERKLSTQLKEGDVVSVKGKGRIILSEVGNITRKDRIAVVIKKLI